MKKFLTATALAVMLTLGAASMGPWGGPPIGRSSSWGPRGWGGGFGGGGFSGGGGASGDW